MNKADAVSRQIIGAAIEIHRQFGPGLLESVYSAALGHALLGQGLTVEMGKPLPLKHEGFTIHRAYVLDLLVEDCVIVEAKSVSVLKGIHVAQLLTYLRLTNLTLGLLLNFNVEILKNGIRRVVNNHPTEPAPHKL